MHRATFSVLLLTIACSGLCAQGTPAEGEPEAVRIPAGTMIREIVVDVHFFSAKAETLRKYGLLTEGPSKTFAAQDLPDIRQRMAKEDVPDLTRLAWPKLTLISGQRAYVAVGSGSKSDYVRDCLPAEKPKEITPIYGTVQEGLVLDFLVRPGEKDGVVYTFLAPRTCRLLGMRECAATVVREGKTQAVTWQEPVLLIAEPRFTNPCELRVKANESLVVPLDYVVKQGASGARAFALDGKVKETYVPAAKKDDVKAAPADHLTVCVLTATVKPPVVAERDWEVPEFNGPTFKFEPAPGKVRPTEDPLFEGQPDQGTLFPPEPSIPGTRPRPLEIK